jgi:tRNA A37 threonylcarbamoyladenosine dehydratase
MNEDLRFGGVQRLFGPAGLERLRRAHVAVIGIGGVGSWAVEALARSGVGALTLVDLDDICVSNVNRQLHAVEGEIGRPKVEVLARRVYSINPSCHVHAVHAFFSASTAAEILAPSFDYVLDAIDRPAAKSLLIARCRERGIPIFVAGGAGGRASATSLRIADLAHSTHDRLLVSVRSHLRRDYGFPRDDTPFGVDCVFSVEPARRPQEQSDACAAAKPEGSLRLDCESGYGTACFVTGAFGFAAAAHIVNRLAAPSSFGQR